MSDQVFAVPRWGNKGRDKKAAAILDTLISCTDETIVQGAWVDMGCGSGGIAATLARSVDSVVGVDPEPWPAWSVMAKAQANLRYVEGACDGPAPPVPENSADIVVCNQVYEHVNAPQALVRNIFRILKPGGRCYFAGPNLLWPIEPHVFWPFVHWLPRTAAHRLMRALGSKQADALDAYSASYWTLAHWFRSCGFRVNDGIQARLAAGFRNASHPRIAEVVSGLPRSLFSALAPLSPSFIFLLEKPTHSQPNACGFEAGPAVRAGVGPAPRP